DISADSALVRGTRGLLLCGGDAALAQYNKRLLHITLGFLKSLQAVAHGRPGLLAELFYLLCIDLLGYGRHLLNHPSIYCLKIRCGQTAKRGGEVVTATLRNSGPFLIFSGALRQLRRARPRLLR